MSLLTEPAPDASPVTRILEQLSSAGTLSETDFVSSVYEELRRVARTHMAWERPDHTLQTTALVHETYLKMVRQKGADYVDRAHFFSVAAEVMRHILIDHARKRRSKKRGDGAQRVELQDHFAISDESLDRVLVIEDALDRLKAQDPRQAQVVTLRVFAGLENSQIAESLGVSVRTVKRDWSHACAWLYGEISE